MVTFGCRKEQMELVQVRMGMGQWWKFCQVFLLSSQSSLLAARPGRVVCQPINQCSVSAYLDMKYYDIKPCCDIHLKIYGPFEALCCFFVLRCSVVPCRGPRTGSTLPPLAPRLEPSARPSPSTKPAAKPKLAPVSSPSAAETPTRRSSQGQRHHHGAKMVDGGWREI